MRTTARTLQSSLAQASVYGIQWRVSALCAGRSGRMEATGFDTSFVLPTAGPMARGDGIDGALRCGQPCRASALGWHGVVACEIGARGAAPRRVATIGATPFGARAKLGGSAYADAIGVARRTREGGAAMERHHVDVLEVAEQRAVQPHATAATAANAANAPRRQPPAPSTATSRTRRALGGTVAKSASTRRRRAARRFRSRTRR